MVEDEELDPAPLDEATVFVAIVFIGVGGLSAAELSLHWNRDDYGHDSRSDLGILFFWFWGFQHSPVSKTAMVKPRYNQYCSHGWFRCDTTDFCTRCIMNWRKEWR